MKKKKQSWKKKECNFEKKKRNLGVGGIMISPHPLVICIIIIIMYGICFHGPYPMQFFLLELLGPFSI
jgi:hypothetical protein